jgi:hypothetical protein
VGEEVLRFTDRAFTAATADGAVMRAARTRLVPRLLPLALRLRPARRLAFRTVSQLGIRYRHTPAVESAIGRSPRPGDRLPDVRLTRAGVPLWLSEALAVPAFALLLYGSHDDDVDEAAADLRARVVPWLVVTRLLPAGAAATDADLVDGDGAAAHRLGLRRSGWLLVRPDGHIGARGPGADLSGAARYLERWLRRSQDSTGELRNSRNIAQ